MILFVIAIVVLLFGLYQINTPIPLMHWLDVYSIGFIFIGVVFGMSMGGNLKNIILGTIELRNEVPDQGKILRLRQSLPLISKWIILMTALCCGVYLKMAFLSYPETPLTFKSLYYVTQTIQSGLLIYICIYMPLRQFVRKKVN